MEVISERGGLYTSTIVIANVICAEFMFATQSEATYWPWFCLLAMLTISVGVS